MLRELLWISLFVVNVHTTKILRCQSDCYSRRKSVTLNDGRSLTCKVQHITKPPNSISTIAKAPVPRLIKDKMWYVHNNSRIALNITWQQKESEISNHDVNGYYITVAEYTNTVSFKMRYNVTFKIKGKKRSRIRHRTDYIWFTFLCHGLKRNYYSDLLYSPMTRLVTIDSLPLADINHNDGQQQHSVTIPECTEESGRVLSYIEDKDLVGEHCEEFWSRLDKKNAGKKVATTATAEMTTTMITKGKLENFILIAFVCVTILLSIVIAIFIWKRKTEGRYGNILAIADMDNDHDIDLHHATMEKLSRQLGFKVQSNWSSRNVIIQKSAAEWFREQLERADVVIFIEPQFDIMSGNEYRMFWRHFINSAQVDKKKSILLQSSGLIHRYKAQETEKFKIFPRQHKYTRDDPFFLHMQNVCKPKLEVKQKHETMDKKMRENEQLL